MERDAAGRAAGRRLAAFLLLALASLGSGWWDAASAQTGVAEPGEPVSATGAVLWDPADERMLWGREPAVPRPMASTTKIMTVLLAVEAGTLDDEVTVSARAADTGRVPGGASLGLREGQRLPMRDLLAGLMLRSGNDAAVAVAEHVAGTEPAFVERMNARAADLGLRATNFLNASGLTDDPAHRASPLDLARLAVVALEHDPIAAWSAAASVDNPTFGHIVNRNELLTVYPGATGVKTGYTSLAGRCLVASAERDGRRLVSVVLGSDDHFSDSATVLDHGFEDWTRLRVSTDVPIGTVRTSAGASSVVPAARVERTVPADADVTTRVTWDPFVGAAVAAGESVGAVAVIVDGEIIDTVAARTTSAIAAPAAVGVGDAVENGLRGLARAAAAAGGSAVDTASALIESGKHGT